jgi:hypothetical protein
MGASQVQQQKTGDLVTIDPRDLADVLGRVSTPPATTVHQLLGTTGPLNTPAIRSRSPGSTVGQSTPCLDERDSENLLPGLLSLNHDDPLLRETESLNHKPSMASVQTQTDGAGEEEPPRKRPRLDEDHSQIAAALQSLASSTMEGMKNIVEAINGNTRAIRCQEKTQEKIVDELARIERKIAQMERTTNKGKENKPLKSVVKKI